MDYVLTTQNLSKHYGRFKALDGLAMHVPRGAIYGLVGRNGAGKTTLIRLICGLQRPSGGSYSLYGAESTTPRLATVRRRMGAVVETPSIYQDLSAVDNLREQYRVLGLPSEEGNDHRPRRQINIPQQDNECHTYGRDPPYSHLTKHDQ